MKYHKHSEYHRLTETLNHTITEYHKHQNSQTLNITTRLPGTCGSLHGVYYFSSVEAVQITGGGQLTKHVGTKRCLDK